MTTPPLRIAPLPGDVLLPDGQRVAWIAVEVFDLLVDLVADKAPGPESEFVTPDVIVGEIQALLADAQPRDGHWLVPLAGAVTDDGVAQIQLCAAHTDSHGFVIVTHVQG